MSEWAGNITCLYWISCAYGSEHVLSSESTSSVGWSGIVILHDTSKEGCMDENKMRLTGTMRSTSWK